MVLGPISIFIIDGSNLIHFRVKKIPLLNLWRAIVHEAFP